MDIRTLTPDDDALWDAFVDASPHGTVFSKPAYLDALGVRRDIVVVEDRGAIQAGIVLARGLFGLPTNPLFVKHLGVLAAPGQGKAVSRHSRQRQAAEPLAKFLRRRAGFDYSFSPGHDDWLPFYWHGFHQETRYTYRLSPGPEDWRRAADQATRNDLTFAARNALVVEKGGETADVVSTVAAVYHRQGARPPVGGPRLSAILDRLRAAGLATVFTARNGNGQVVGTAVTVADARTSFLLLTGFVDGALRGTTTALVAAAIDDSLAQGRVFDFEGSMIRPIEAFYRGFGGQLTPYHRIWSPGLLNGGKRMAYAAARRVLGYAR